MTSQEEGASMVLVPSSEPEKGHSAVTAVLETHELLLLSTRAVALLIQRRDEKSIRFTVEKMTMDNPSTHDLDEENLAKHVADGHKIIIAPDFNRRSILLGPTMLGRRLYAPDSHPDAELEAQYGTIFPVLDQEDGWGLRIVMPHLPYREILSEVEVYVKGAK